MRFFIPVHFHTFNAFSLACLALLQQTGTFSIPKLNDSFLTTLSSYRPASCDFIGQSVAEPNDTDLPRCTEAFSTSATDNLALNQFCGDGHSHRMQRISMNVA